MERSALTRMTITTRMRPAIFLCCSRFQRITPLRFRQPRPITGASEQRSSRGNPRSSRRSSARGPRAQTLLHSLPDPAANFKFNRKAERARKTRAPPLLLRPRRAHAHALFEALAAGSRGSQRSSTQLDSSSTKSIDATRCEAKDLLPMYAVYVSAGENNSKVREWESEARSRDT